ncbi:MAG: sugar-binding transcriptional regulator [Roseinatronobacter sp.]
MRMRGRAAPPDDRHGNYHYSPMVKAAWMYFKDGLPQHEIAEAMGVSRATVSNLLAAAREAGVYRISFDPDVFDQMSVADALKARFGLRAVLIAPSAGSVTDTRARVARAGAWHLTEAFADCAKLGVCWGQTVLELGDALESVETRIAHVCQMVGVARSALCKLAEACNSRIATKLGAEVLQFPAPGIMSSRELKAQLIREPIVAEQLDQLRGLDAAVFGICSVAPDSPFFASGLARNMQPEDLTRHAVAGIVGGRMFTEAGTEVRLEGYDDCLLALTLDELRCIPRRLGVAGGTAKVAAIRGALRAGLLTALATDFDTARALLEQP